MNPLIPFFWGISGIFVGGELIDLGNILGYCTGGIAVTFGFLSLKELGKKLIVFSSIQLIGLAILSLVFSLILGNAMEVGLVARFVVAVGVSVFISALVPLYYRFFST